MDAIINRYFGKACLHPAIVGVGQSHQRRARPGILSVCREDAYFQLSLVEQGDLTAVAGTEVVRVPPGSMACFFPGELRGSLGGAMPPCRFTWIQIVSAAVEPELRRILTRLRRRILPDASHLRQHIEDILAECTHPDPASPLVVDARLRLFLIGLDRLHARAQPSTATRLPGALQRALARLESTPDAWPGLAALARVARASQAHVSALFRRHLGVAPATWHRDRRLDRAARQLVESDADVQRVALDAGYATAQHFATAFRRRFGRSPTQWRQRR